MLKVFFTIKMLKANSEESIEKYADFFLINYIFCLEKKKFCEQHILE